MRVRVLLFAGLREAVGSKDVDLEVADGASLGELLQRVEALHPVVERYRGRLLVAVNAERVGLDTLLGDGDEVALLPPVSGGSVAGTPFVRTAALSMDELLAYVNGPEMGGLVSFTGVVRNQARGEPIDHLEYEAYPPLAEREMVKIQAEALDRWPHVKLAMSHRVGRLEIGDAAVMIAAAAPHRADAFEACRFAIDALKQRVPIWKKEFATSGAYWVEENP